jgi:transmembrane sensor
LTKDDKTDALLEQATDWLLRLNDAPEDAQLARELDAWLAMSAQHRAAWDKAQRAWALVGEVEPVHRDLWDRPAPPAAEVVALKPRRHWLKWSAGALIAASVAVGAFLAAPGILLRLEADHITQTAEIRVVTLDDGSAVTLGPGSALAVDFSPGERTVRLLSGEAYFDVASNPARPFVVHAGELDVTVLGTAFNLRLASQATSVALARGSVEVSSGAQEIVLVPGEMAILDHTRELIATMTVDAASIGSWQQGWIFVENQTIADVVELLQRYHPAWITVPDANFARQQVTGLFELSDPDRALNALVQPHGGSVVSVSPFVRILTR